MGIFKLADSNLQKAEFKAWKYADKGAGKVDLLQLNKTSNASYKIELRFD